jgi:glutamine synthetase adenylyltransferase
MSSDAQVHTLPGEPYAVRALARTLGYAEREGGAAGAFLADHARHTAVVHRIFTGLFQDGAAAQRAWPPLARVRPNRRS